MKGPDKVCCNSKRSEEPRRLYRLLNARLWAHKRLFIASPHPIHFPTTTTADIINTTNSLFSILI